MKPDRYAAAAKLSYTLPATVETMRIGWISAFQSAATVSGLLAAVEAQMLSFFKDGSKFKQSGSNVQTAAVILTYVAIIASVSATLGSLILTDEFAEMPVRAARDPDIHFRRHDEFAGKDWQLLSIFGLRRSVRLVVYHWLISLLLASLCTVASIATYVISQEGRCALIIVSVTTALSVLPVAHFFIGRNTTTAVYRPPSQEIQDFPLPNGIPIQT